MQEESPEGGRFKKEVVVDGQSYLLLIRDEGGPPELQVQFTLEYLMFQMSSTSTTVHKGKFLKLFVPSLTLHYVG